MKRRLLVSVLVMAGWYQAGAIAASSDEAGVNGAAASAVGMSVLNGSDASATVPGYTTTPPETSYYGTTNLSAPATAGIAACGSSTSPTCEATNTTIGSAAAPRPPLGPYDPSVAAVRDIQNNPTATLGDLSGYYAGCTTTTATTPAGIVNKLCARYVGEGNIRCANRLGGSGTLVESCVPNTYLSITSGDDYYYHGAFGTHGNGEAWRFAGVYVRPVCAIDSTTVKMRLTAFCTEEPCAGDVTIEVDAATGAVSPQSFAGFIGRSWYGTDIFNRLYYDGGKCVGDNCAFTFHTAYYHVECVDVPNADGTTTSVCTPSETIRASATMKFTAGHYEYAMLDSWDDQCALLTSTSGFGTCTLKTGPACVDGPSTKKVQGHDVTRACWEYDSTYNCTNGPPTDECAPLAAAGCVNTASTCKETVPGDPSTCGIYQDTYQCTTAPSTTSTVTSCPTTSFCVGDGCYSTASPSDADFARTVTFLEAGREAGKYLDPNNLIVFNGADNRCDVKLFGITNCCSGGGGGSGSLTNLNVAGTAAMTLGKAAFSTYTYDALFVSDAPNWVISGFESLFGTGMDSALVGVMAGDLTVADFMMSMVPGPWTFVMLAIQLSGLLDCEQQEQITAMKKDAGLCQDIGTYCSEDILGICLVDTHTYCCFNSRLSLIINQQGRAQLGRGWGSPEGPDCKGFTIAELQSLNFAAMDLSAFYAEIVPTAPNVGGTVSAQATKLPNCYYGQGKCQ